MSRSIGSCRPALSPLRIVAQQLAIAIVSDQAVSLSCGVELVLDVSLLERTGGDPSPERPGSSVQSSVPATRRRHLEGGQHAHHVGFAAALVIAVVLRDRVADGDRCSSGSDRGSSNGWIRLGPVARALSFDINPGPLAQ